MYSGARNGEFWSLSSHNLHSNQNHNKILERDWLSSARSKREQDSVRVMLVIGWSNMTVDTSCLCKWTVSDVVAHFAVLIFFLMKTYNWCLFSLSNFVIVLTNWKKEFKSSNSICNHTRNYQIWLPLRGLPISIITRMIQTELDSTQSYYHYLLHMYKLHKASYKKGGFVEELSLPQSRVTSHVFQVLLAPLRWNTCTHTCSLHSWQRFVNEPTALRSAWVKSVIDKSSFW